MAGLTAEALFPAFLSMTENERVAFLKMGQATVKKEDIKKTASRKAHKSVHDKVCSVLGEAFRPGNEEMLISQIMQNK